MLHRVENKQLFKRVIAFLEDYDVYRNPHGVHFSYSSNKSVMVGVAWRGPMQDHIFDMEIDIYGLPIEEFASLFNIHAVQDIKAITRGTLAALFRIGKAEVSCIITGPLDCYSISYRRQNELLIATDDSGDEHIVSKNLITYNDYRAYSFNYYELFNDIK